MNYFDYRMGISAQRRDKQGAMWLFLIGAFSMTQLKLGAKIGISEAGCCLASLFIYARDYMSYRREGVSAYFNLLLFWIAGALFSDFYNHSVFAQLMRGVSVPVTIFCVSVCIYHFLRRNPDNLKWLLFGIAVSSIISIFVFQRGRAGDLAAEGNIEEAIEGVIGYKLFWSNMAKTWLYLPIQCLYMKVPFFYAIPAMVVVSLVNITIGGRSSFATSVVGLFLVLIVGKRIESMRRVRRYFPILIVTLIAVMFAIKGAYSYAATHGYLNEYETIKYQRQTAQGAGFMSLLMAGRGDFFIGLIAALDKPIVGHGSQALDTHGYERDFVSKYGTIAETEEFNKRYAKGYLRAIKAHSHVIQFWMWHGIAGLLFWLYILWLVFQTIRKRLAYVPEWFGYLAIVLPDFLWDYFFSPFGLRVTGCALFCTLLVLVRIERLKQRGMMP